MKSKVRILVFLLFAYGACCVVPSYACVVFSMCDNSEMMYERENSDSPFSIPLSSERETSNVEDNFPQDDENFYFLPDISFLKPSTSRLFNQNNSLLPGHLNIPYSPPQAASC